MKKLLTLSTLFLLLTTCIDEIDLADGAPLPDGIVFQGRMNVQEDNAEVFVVLERLFRFGESNRPSRVTNANIVLENSEGQSVDLDFRNGGYRVEFPEDAPDFIIRPGVGYRVRARIGDEQYSTAFDVLPEPLQVGEASIELGLAERETVAGTPTMDSAVFYFVDAPVEYPDGSPTYIRYTTEQIFKVTDTPMNGPNRNNPPKVCYITSAVEGSNIRLISSETTTVDNLNDFQLATTFLGEDFAEGNVLSVFQEMISRDAFRYFDQIDRVNSREASIFEPPGGPVVGNASDDNNRTDNVFGFFYVANRTVSRVAVSPEQANFPAKRCPRPPSGSPFPRPNSCDDCLTINRSTDVRPDFFPF